MKEYDNTLFGALVFAALLIPLVLTVSGGWSWWYLVLAVVLLLAVAALRIHYVVRRDQDSSAAPLEAAPHPAVSEPPAQDAISEVDLRSNTADYRLVFSATVLWEPSLESPQSSHVDPGALAKHAIVERAGAMLEICG